MKMDRLLGIVILLLQRDQVTAPELAERFEVSRRTISRDIEEICQAGIPLVTRQGSGGGISIAEGYKIDKALLTNEELQSILAGVRGLDSVSRSAGLKKLMEKLSGRDRQVTVDDTIVIDLASYYQESLSQKIELLRDAAKLRKYVSFRYYAPKGESVRMVEPYRLVFRWSAWYVFGFCRERQDFRLFKLNRLWELAETGETFLPREIPTEALDFERWQADEKYRLKARFAPSEKYRLIEEYGVGCFTAGADGELLFERAFANYSNMLEWVSSFGDRVTVLAPQVLRDDLRRQAINLLQKYSET